MVFYMNFQSVYVYFLFFANCNVTFDYFKQGQVSVQWDDIVTKSQHEEMLELENGKDRDATVFIEVYLIIYLLTLIGHSKCLNDAIQREVVYD